MGDNQVDRELLSTVKKVKQLELDKNRMFYSAEHGEILSGLTTDIYFVRAKETLNKLGVGKTPVVAEIFAQRSGTLAGLHEMLALLRGRGVEVWAQPEGTSFEKNEVVVRVKGLYDDFGIYETAMLGFLASSSGWAAAAAEVKEAAGDKPFFCFGARHVHPAVAPVMEKCAIIGGAQGASCILGAKIAGMEPSGTVPHAFFLIVGDTVEASKAYNKFMPKDSLRVMLVDTFKDEVEETLRVAEELGRDLDGVRLDTPKERGGVTPGLIKEVRHRLDLAGHGHVKIFVSGGLTPERIKSFVNAGADAFGVGSYISAAPPIDMTMDIKEVDGRPIAKRGRLPGVTPGDRLEKIL
ncbi:MAG: nicotinate phosphoribosyltransferase [Clostridia bacterium]|nr:nicotinate phosphoribosyltransferase [Clostridia bacterium]